MRFLSRIHLVIYSRTFLEGEKEHLSEFNLSFAKFATDTLFTCLQKAVEHDFALQKLTFFRVKFLLKVGRGGLT